MGAGGIYKKTCPRCAAILDRDIERCGCGHGFEADAPGAPQPQTADDDGDLYQAYLAARIEQALAALELARAQLRAVPGDFHRALRVMQEVHEVQSLRLELERLRTGGDGELDRPCAVDLGFRTPTEAFRAAQAARAEAIARRNAHGQPPGPQDGGASDPSSARGACDAHDSGSASTKLP